ncbi:solute carrier family 28 member 3 [Biomphalaria pfeifferi]|uniref:Solute carrier family 28 member 3 n=1 Tax=Biomphalaria pfeifferi TaxID=112525 RepID=A0AAD8F1F8_BIOPF|nr:solute carrier family 28 member 3 [Biomphalaria pfeifferi]
MDESQQIKTSLSSNEDAQQIPLMTPKFSNNHQTQISLTDNTGVNNDIVDDCKADDVSIVADIDITMEICPLVLVRSPVFPHGQCSKFVEKMEIWFGKIWQRQKKKFFLSTKILACLLYLTYFGYCVHHRYYDEGSYILTAFTGLLVIKVVFKLTSGQRGRARNLLKKHFYKCYVRSRRTKYFRSITKYVLYVAASVLVCVYVGVFVLPHSPTNSQAVIGLVLMVILCFLFSSSPSRVNWHPVFWGFILQFTFAVLTLRTTMGYETFKWIGDAVHNFVRLSDQGSAFVFGDSFKAAKAGFFFESAGVIVFFNSFIFVLDYYGVLEFIVLKIGQGLSFCLETGPVESVVSAANIFIGLSEAPLLVRPYLPTVTRSELHAIMTCGFSSISGAFMAMFIKSGAPANHLLTAAVISAPAALAVSKLLYPEMDRADLENQKNIKMRDENSSQNLLQAASDGATFSIKLVASIMVNMMAFVSILNLINTTLVWIGERAGVPGMTFDLMCSYLMYPLAYVMGTASEDCGKVGALIGLKFVATPFVAYAELGLMVKNRHTFESYVREYNGTWYTSGDDVILTDTNTTLFKGFMAEKSEAISTYAICGLSAFPAIGFCLGTLAPMCPARKDDVIDLVLRAFVAGNIANFVTASVAGVLYMNTQCPGYLLSADGKVCI